MITVLLYYYTSQPNKVIKCIYITILLPSEHLYYRPVITIFLYYFTSTHNTPLYSVIILLYSTSTLQPFIHQTCNNDIIILLLACQHTYIHCYYLIILLYFNQMHLCTVLIYYYTIMPLPQHISIQCYFVITLYTTDL